MSISKDSQCTLHSEHKERKKERVSEREKKEKTDSHMI